MGRCRQRMMMVTPVPSPRTTSLPRRPSPAMKYVSLRLAAVLSALP
jgi:hypothetical protein